ncbi:MAG TPA: S8 family serine peptidase [Micromonosporaceae bacterium]|nr:S8 family serine peptidase [Micromonosporaceae bacterium]
MSQPPARSSPVAVVAAVLAGGWVVGVTIVVQALAWVLEQAEVLLGRPAPGWVWPAAAWLAAFVAGVPVLLVALVPRSPAVRAAGRAWLLAVAGAGLLGSLRAVPVLRQELYLALLALVAGGLAVAVAARWRPAAAPRVSGGLALASAAGLACLLPWLWLGALGGAHETALAALAALAVGGYATALLPSGFWTPFTTGGRVRLVLVGGLVAGVALVPLAAGVGGSGVHLAALLAVPPLGFAVAALAPWGPGPRWLLVALGAVGPLAFVDPEETWLLLNIAGRDAAFWVAVAALAQLALALVAGAALAAVAVRGRPSVPWPGPAAPHWTATPRLAAAATAVAVAATGLTGYAVAGQPGLHGDRLFVVLREQADLSGVAGIAGRAERLGTAYRRLVGHADRTQAPLRRQLARAHLSYTPYYLVNAVEVRGGAAVGAWLARRPEVDRVLMSPRLRPLPAPAQARRGGDPIPAGPLWNVQLVDADRVWRELGVTGRGIVVGTSDSGVDGAHPALAPGFRGGDDSWYDPWNGTLTPADHTGHGTHTLGSAVGRAPDGSAPDGGVPPGRAPPGRAQPAVHPIGVAPEAQWAGCVNLDRNLGNPALYLDCLQFMLAPFHPGGDPLRDGRPERAPHVLTNSWSCPPLEGCDATVLRPATSALTAAGIFFVAAAGNAGPACGSLDEPPAPDPDAFTVAAVDQARAPAEFSSRGPASGGAAKPDLAAPGVAVLSALPGGTYGRLDGTSMAAPHVAGVVALMWSANPGLIGDVTRTAQILRETAKPALPASGDGGDDTCGGPRNAVGAGVLDAFAAVRAAQAAGR